MYTERVSLPFKGEMTRTVQHHLTIYNELFPWFFWPENRDRLQSNTLLLITLEISESLVLHLPG